MFLYRLSYSTIYKGVATRYTFSAITIFLLYRVVLNRTNRLTDGYKGQSADRPKYWRCDGQTGGQKDRL